MLQFVSSVLSMSFVTVSAPCSMEQQTHMFLSLPFAATVPTEAFLVTFPSLYGFISQISFGFPKISTTRWSNALLGQSICASYFHKLPFCVGVQLGVPYTSVLVSCHAYLVFCILEQTALLLRGASPWRSTSCPEPHTDWILPKRFPSRPKPAFLKSRIVILLALPISLKIFNSTVLFLLQPCL